MLPLILLGAAYLIEKSLQPDIRYEKGGTIDKLIKQGIIELKMYDTTPEHAQVYGFEAKNPLYIQLINVSEGNRQKGIGKKILKHIDNCAIENGNDVIFGHITQQAEPSIEIIKSMLNKSGFNTIEDNNDFYKLVSNPDIRYEEGGEVGYVKIDGKEATQEEFIEIYQAESFNDFFNLNPKKIEYNGNDIKIKKDVEDYNREISPYFKSGELKSSYMKEIVVDAFYKFSFRKFGDAYRKNIDKYFTAENNAMGLRKGYTWKEKASYIVGDSYYHNENKFRGFAKDLGITIPPNKS